MTRSKMLEILNMQAWSLVFEETSVSLPGGWESFACPSIADPTHPNWGHWRDLELQFGRGVKVIDLSLAQVGFNKLQVQSEIKHRIFLRVVYLKIEISTIPKSNLGESGASGQWQTPELTNQLDKSPTARRLSAAALDRDTGSSTRQPQIGCKNVAANR